MRLAARFGAVLPVSAGSLPTICETLLKPVLMDEIHLKPVLMDEIHLKPVLMDEIHQAHCCGPGNGQVIEIDEDLARSVGSDNSGPWNVQKMRQ